MVSQSNLLFPHLPFHTHRDYASSELNYFYWSHHDHYLIFVHECPPVCLFEKAARHREREKKTHGLSSSLLFFKRVELYSHWWWFIMIHALRASVSLPDYQGQLLPLYSNFHHLKCIIKINPFHYIFVTKNVLIKCSYGLQLPLVLYRPTRILGFFH